MNGVLGLPLPPGLLYSFPSIIMVILELFSITFPILCLSSHPNRVLILRLRSIENFAVPYSFRRHRFL